MAGIQSSITLCPTAYMRMDAVDFAAVFAWLISKHNLTVVGYSDCAPTGESVLFVKATYAEQISRFTDEVNEQFGSLIFKEVEILDGKKYVDLDNYLKKVS